MHDDMRQSSSAEGRSKSLFKTSNDVDWLLVHFIRYAEAGVNFGVSLSIGGSIVYGEMISSQMYFALLSAQLENANWNGPQTEHASPHAISKAMSRFGEMATLIDESEAKQLTYIHLRNVQLFPAASGGQCPQMLWRFKLSQVDGFSVQSCF